MITATGEWLESGGSAQAGPPLELVVSLKCLGGMHAGWAPAGPASDTAGSRPGDFLRDPVFLSHFLSLSQFSSPTAFLPVVLKMVAKHHSRIPYE